MNAYVKKIDVRWSDLDPNFHLRHSVYYDYGAYSRICFLEEHGLGTAYMAENHLGPILFREECVFRREIKMGDPVTIDLQLLKAREDQSRWSMRHHIYKNGDTLAAIITVDGAWIDTQLRKLAAPQAHILEGFAHMPRATDFEWIK